MHVNKNWEGPVVLGHLYYEWAIFPTVVLRNAILLGHYMYMYMHVVPQDKGWQGHVYDNDRNLLQNNNNHHHYY